MTSANLAPTGHGLSHGHKVILAQALPRQWQDSTVFPGKMTTLQGRKRDRIPREDRMVLDRIATCKHPQGRNQPVVKFTITFVFCFQHRDGFLEPVIFMAALHHQRKQVVFFVGDVERHFTLEIVKHHPGSFTGVVRSGLLGQMFQRRTDQQLAIMMALQELQWPPHDRQIGHDNLPMIAHRLLVPCCSHLDLHQPTAEGEAKLRGPS